MEVHFICSGPVLRRGVGRKGLCVHMAGLGWGMAGGEAGRSINMFRISSISTQAESRNMRKGVIEMHI